MGEIKVTVSANKPKSVSVKNQQVANEISASADTGRIWAQTSKNWAVSDNIVDNTDYSSKYYANQAKESASNAEAFESTIRDVYNGFLGETTEAIENVQGVRDEAIANIETSRTEAVDSINSTKTTILNDIEFVADGEKQEINELADVIKDNANTVNVAIEAGVERLNSIDALKNNQITNCILEIPQRIKYTLENGTLSIKAGSVVIVPYGTEDLTAQYPKGATFLHENFKVYDTQFADDRFFVWAELVEDVSYSYSGSTTTDFYVYCIINSNQILISQNATSGATAPASGLFYNTSVNEIYHNSSSQIQYRDIALPLAIGTRSGGAITGIKQTFNGMGYIGSTIWVDKGIKGLIPNGRNTDGTLNNIEFISHNIVTSTSTSTQDYTIRLGYNSTLTIMGLSQRQTRYNLTVNTLKELDDLDASVAYHVYVVDENRNYYTSNSQWYVSADVRIINVTLTSGVVSNFIPKQPFRAVDYNQVDGFPVFNNLTLVNGFTESMEKTFDLSDYLPKDNYSYEVFVSGYGNTGTTSGNTLSISISTSLLNGNMQVFACRTRTASSVCSGGSCIVYVGADRKMTVNNAGQASSGTSFIALRGYRRLGIRA